MKNDNDNNGNKVSIPMDAKLLYNLCACVLNQADTVTRKIENYLFALNNINTQTIDINVDLEIKNLTTTLAMVTPLVDNYLVYYSDLNDKDGDGLLDREMLLANTLDNYNKAIKKINETNSMNKMLKNIGGIELLT